MNDPEEKETLPEPTETFGGAVQKVIGEIETIGGVLTGDPLTRAEGEFNIEVGTLRDKVEEDIESERPA